MKKSRLRILFALLIGFAMFGTPQKSNAQAITIIQDSACWGTYVKILADIFPPAGNVYSVTANHPFGFSQQITDTTFKRVPGVGIGNEDTLIALIPNVLHGLNPFAQTAINVAGFTHDSLWVGGGTVSIQYTPPFCKDSILPVDPTGTTNPVYGAGWDANFGTVDPVTGALNLAGVNPGISVTVDYYNDTIDGCQSRATTTFDVDDPMTVDWGYPDTCSDWNTGMSLDPVLTATLGTLGNFTFSQVGAVPQALGAALNTVNGQITGTGAMATGTYTIQVRADEQGGNYCPVEDQETFDVAARQVALFDYGANPRCDLDQTGWSPCCNSQSAYIYPNKGAGFTDGGTWSYTPGNQTLEKFDDAYDPNDNNDWQYGGRFQPGDNSTDMGTYSITYETPGPTCKDTYTLSYELIAGSPGGNSGWAIADTVCKSTRGYVLPDSIASPGGTFTLQVGNPGGLVIVNDSIGIFDISNANPGSFNITYTSAGGAGCSGSTTHELYILPDMGSFSYPSTPYCPNHVGQVLPTQPLPRWNGFFQELSGGINFVSQATGEIDIAASQPGFYTILFISTNPCRDTAYAPFRILPPGDTAFGYTSQTFCTNGIDPSPVVPGGIQGTFVATPPGGLQLTTGTGYIDLSASDPGGYNIRYLVNSGGCTYQAFDSLYVVAQDTADFDYPVDTVCPGQPNPIPIYVADSFPVGLFSEFTNNVVFADSATGEIDMNLTPPGGPYVVLFNSSGQCPDFHLSTISIPTAQSATFHYEFDNPNGNISSPIFCTQNDNPYPVLDSGTVGGGVWSYTNFFLTAPNAVLALDTVTGKIDLDATFLGNKDAGWFIIRYDVGGCGDFHTEQVQILAQPSPVFSYPFTQYCITDPDPSPILQDSSTYGLGVFSEIGGSNIVWADDTLGIIDLASSNAQDSITIQYYAPDSVGLCPDSAIYIISIVAPDSTISFSYPNNTYCQNGLTDPRPTVVNGDSTGFFTSDPIALTFVDESPSFISSSGIIDLANTPPGTYKIEYRLSGACPVDTGISITITAADNADFTYTDTSYCQLDDTISPTMDDPNITGTFTYRGTGLAMDFPTGEIDLGNSAFGFYDIQFQSTSGCPSLSSWPLEIKPIPDPTLKALPDSGKVCTGEDISFTISGNDFVAADVEWYLNAANTPFQIGDAWDSNGLTTGDMVWIRAEAAECIGFDTIVVAVYPKPLIDSINSTEVISGDKVIEVAIFAGTNDTRFQYEVIEQIGLEGINIGPPGRRVTPTDTANPTVNIGEMATIIENIEMTNPLFPGRIRYMIYPEAFSCIGDTDTVLVNINPENQLVFVPGVITPNGDGKNDLWYIQVDNNVKPEEYTIKVFNRVGGIVFEMNDLSEDPWDGGDAPDGVYWWILSSRSGDQRRGGLKIIRKRLPQ